MQISKVAFFLVEYKGTIQPAISGFQYNFSNWSDPLSITKPYDVVGISEFFVKGKLKFGCSRMHI